LYTEYNGVVFVSTLALYVTGSVFEPRLLTSYRDLFFNLLSTCYQT